VLVDDSMPVNQNGQLMFASNQSRALWPMLIEKAYAKVSSPGKIVGDRYVVLVVAQYHLTYSNIIGGRISDGDSS